MKGAIQIVLSKVRSFILWIFATVRRAFCCFRARPLHLDLPLHSVGVVPNDPAEVKSIIFYTAQVTETLCEIGAKWNDKIFLSLYSKRQFLSMNCLHCVKDVGVRFLTYTAK
jgi:hypothetical protein